MFFDDFDDSGLSTVSGYTDTEPESKVEPDDQSDAEEETETDDNVQYNRQSQSPVGSRKPLPFMGDSGVKVALEENQSPFEIFHFFFYDKLLDHIVSKINEYAANACLEKKE